MPRFRCPRCSTIVTAAAGAAPACPACGFGAPAAAPALAAAPVVAPLAAPAPPPPLPPSPPAAPAPVAGAWTPAPVGPPLAPAAAPPPPRGNGGKVAALVVVGVLVLAGLAAAAWFLLGVGGGGLGGGDDLTQAEAEERLASSLAAAGGALAGGDAPDALKEVTMTMESPPGAAGTDEVFGAGDMEVTITYGRDDVVRMQVRMESGPATIELTLICTPTQVFLVYGGDAYGSRESVEPTEEDCSEGGGMFGLPDDGLEGEVPGEEATDLPYPTFDDLDIEDADITIHRDGSITAVVEDEESVATIDIDEDGRVVRVQVEGRGEAEGMEAVMDFAYGSRPSIDLPEDYALLPASVATDRVDDGATTTWTVTESPHEPRLAELEVRVQDFAFGFPDADAVPLATFELRSGEQREGNFTFRFTDGDGDGRLTAGDSYVLVDLEQQAEDAAEAEDPSGFGFDFDFPSHDVVLYDLEADGAVNSGPAALMPSPLWLVVAALAAAVLALRRSR